MRGPLARLSIYALRIALRCAGLRPAFRCARAGLRSGARASGPPVNVHAQGYAQVREPLARPLICARRCAGLWPAFRSARTQPSFSQEQGARWRLAPRSRYQRLSHNRQYLPVTEVAACGICPFRSPTNLTRGDKQRTASPAMRYFESRLESLPQCIYGTLTSG